ncbi:MAG: hypothetical protein PHF25_08245 [Candidatus Margulisbacteria bacterium]|nr:hypothetical protein [Candidatus Margulisiibacteriota bacterium]
MEMINVLTNGIGTNLGKEIRVEYFNNKTRLLKLVNHKNLDKIDTTSLNVEYFWDMLALAIFHEKVIVPFHGSINFIKNTRSYGVKQVEMGSYTLDNHYLKKTESITTQFFAIINKYELTIEQLNIPNIEAHIKAGKSFSDL